MTTGPIPHREDPTTKRRLRVHIGAEMVAQLLDLPPGHRLVAVDCHNDPLAIVAICEGPDFPESPIEAESPIGHFYQTVHRDAETNEVVHVERELRWFGQDTGPHPQLVTPS